VIATRAKSEAGNFLWTSMTRLLKFYYGKLLDRKLRTAMQALSLGT